MIVNAASSLSNKNEKPRFTGFKTNADENQDKTSLTNKVEVSHTNIKSHTKSDDYQSAK